MYLLKGDDDHCPESVLRTLNNIPDREPSKYVFQGSLIADSGLLPRWYRVVDYFTQYILADNNSTTIQGGCNTLFPFYLKGRSKSASKIQITDTDNRDLKQITTVIKDFCNSYYNNNNFFS